MRSSQPCARRALAFGVVAILLLAAASFAVAESPNSFVYPPDSEPFGKTYSEWSAAWWQWAYGLPVVGHPLFDETGVAAAAGQSGPVWFLGGVFNVSGTAHRTIEVPKGTALFFPILNVEWDNVCPPDNLTIEELRATAAFFMDLATDLSCEVDGVSIPDPARFRTTAGPFSVTIPDGSIWQAFGCDNAVAGTYSPLVGDGYYIMLKSLPRGHHTVHFSGTVGPPVSFSLDITYDINVMDKKAEAASAVSPLLKSELSRFSPNLPGSSSAPPAAALGRPSLAPNPIRHDGVIRFTLSRPGRVEAKLFDVSGRVLRVLADGSQWSAGAHELRVNRDAGGSLTPGLYFYRISTDEGAFQGRVTVLP